MAQGKHGDRIKCGNSSHRKKPGIPTVLTFFIFLMFALFLPVIYARSSYAADYFMDLRVGISLAGDHLELSFDNEYCFFHTTGDEPLPLNAGHYKLENAGGRIEVCDLREGGRESFQGPLILQPVATTFADSSFLLHNALYGREYRGALEIIAEGGGLLAVNVLDPESYLRGVLPAEIPPLWGNDGGMEALKAQAIAARTFALFNREACRHSRYHLCDQQHCQVYKGKDAENRYTDQAVDETYGEILTYGGRIIESFYHASNGGFTELSENVWQTPSPYLDSRPDPYDDPDNPLDLPGFKCFPPWVVTVSRQLLRDQLAEKGYNTSEIERINIVSSFASGRVEDVVLQARNGGTILLSKEKAWTVLGLSSQLYTLRSGGEIKLWAISARPGFEKKDYLPGLEGRLVVHGYNDQVNALHGHELFLRGDRVETPVCCDAGGEGDLVFEGLGRGHGVGMSQYGAYNRSRAGHSYRDILSFYYPGAEIAIL